MVQRITQRKNGLHDPFQLDRASDLISTSTKLVSYNISDQDNLKKERGKKIKILASSATAFTIFKLFLRSET